MALDNEMEGWAQEVCENAYAAAAPALPYVGWTAVLLLYLGAAVWRSEPADPPAGGAARLVALVAVAALAERHMFQHFYGHGLTVYISRLVFFILICNISMAVIWYEVERFIYHDIVVPFNYRFAKTFGFELGEEIMQFTITFTVACMLLIWIIFSNFPMSSFIRKVRKIFCMDPYPVRIVNQVDVRNIVAGSHQTAPAPPEPIKAPAGFGPNPLIDPPAGP